jgi:hypothetical protein
MGSFDAKKPPSKISCLGTFNTPVTNEEVAAPSDIQFHLHRVTPISIGEPTQEIGERLNQRTASAASINISCCYTL